ncbi:MAG: MFS transporter [Spirochaetes bacterium]|nr:MFS transporter [Spirochaetota bacterium]MBU0956240.1 MFS transporter [Spirochaetota bacterium]
MTDQTVLVRSSYIWVLYFLLGIFSFMLTMIGPMVPYLQAETGMSYSLAGFHQTIVAIAMVIMGFSAAPIMKRLGVQRSLWGSLAGLVAGVAVMTLGRGLFLSMSGVFLMALSGTLLLSSIQLCFAHEAQAVRGRMIMEANVMASIMTMLVPLVLLAGRYTPFGWRIVLPFLAILGLALAAFGIRQTRQKLKDKHAEHHRKEERLPGRYWRMWLIIFAGVTVEWAISFWCMSYLLEIPETGIQLATAGTVVLGISAVFGRLVSSRLAKRYSDRQLLLMMLVLLGAGFPFYWMQAGIAASFFGLMLCGFSTSTFYPLGLSMSLSAAPAAVAKASAMAPVASGSAIGLAPFLLGRLADTANMKTALLYVPIGLLLILVIIAVDVRYEKRNKLTAPA